MKLIAYHGTDKDFDSFKLPEDLPQNFINFSNGYLGIYFTENRDIAKMFCKKKWYVRNSQYKPNSKLITVEIEFFNPRFMYPIESATRANSSPQHQLTLRWYLMKHYHHDSVIIDIRKPDENYRVHPVKEILPWKSEYDARQIVIFQPERILIKDIKPLN